MTRAVTATKRSWPLLLVAACSFIPGLGFFVGAIAVAWALLSDRPRARVAAVFAGLGAFANLAGIILVSVYMNRTPEMARFNQEMTRQDLVRVVYRLYQYHLAPDGGTYDLYSVGPDGRPGTDDDIRPVLPDSVAARSGYRPSHEAP